MKVPPSCGSACELHLQHELFEKEAGIFVLGLIALIIIARYDKMCELRFDSRFSRSGHVTCDWAEQAAKERSWMSLLHDGIRLLFVWDVNKTQAQRCLSSLSLQRDAWFHFCAASYSFTVFNPGQRILFYITQKGRSSEAGMERPMCFSIRKLHWKQSKRESPTDEEWNTSLYIVDTDEALTRPETFKRSAS